MFDVLSIVLLIVCVLWGYVRGILRGLLSLASLLVAYWGSAPLGASFGHALVGRAGWPEVVDYTVGRVAAGLLIYVSLTVSAHVADRKFGQTRQGIARRWNRNWGAVGGLVSGLLLVLMLLFAADSLLKAFPDARGALADSARNSTLRKLVSRFNPADSFLMTDTVRLLIAARNDPEVLRRLSEDPQIKALLQEPDVRSVMEDQGLAEALRTGQIESILQNQNLRRLLNNAELRQKILSPEVREAMREAVQPARQN
jgi:hypothetical protein